MFRSWIWPWTHKQCPQHLPLSSPDICWYVVLPSDHFPQPWKLPTLPLYYFLQVLIQDIPYVTVLIIFSSLTMKLDRELLSIAGSNYQQQEKKWFSVSETQLCSQHTLKLDDNENVCMIYQGRSGSPFSSQWAKWLQDAQKNKLAANSNMFSYFHLPLRPGNNHWNYHQNVRKGQIILRTDRGSIFLVGKGLSQEYLEKRRIEQLTPKLWFTKSYAFPGIVYQFTLKTLIDSRPSSLCPIKT